MRCFLHCAAGLSYGSLGSRTLARAAPNGLAELGERDLGEFFGDDIETVCQRVELLAHGNSSATISSGCIVTTEAAARCIAQPGFALATTVA